MSNVRNLARVLWINANPPHGSNDPKAKQPSAFMKLKGKTYQPSNSIKNPVITSASLRTEKERALKLMVAFVVAVKHHLRRCVCVCDINSVTPDCPFSVVNKASTTPITLGCYRPISLGLIIEVSTRAENMGTGTTQT
jgi:hypothetical protein